ncbi:hypothetical protein M432DRAFT_39517 [Thermoascus aurantiacus ATCC 26904]
MGLVRHFCFLRLGSTYLLPYSTADTTTITSKFAPAVSHFKQVLLDLKKTASDLTMMRVTTFRGTIFRTPRRPGFFSHEVLHFSCYQKLLTPLDKVYKVSSLH